MAGASLWAFQRARLLNLAIYLFLTPLRDPSFWALFYCMPIEYRIDARKHWLEAKLSGHVSIEEVSDHMRQLFADPGYSDDLNGVIDCRELVNVMSVNELRGLVDMQIERPGPPWRSRRAVVVSSPAHYGTARVFMVFAEAGPVQYNVFYNMETALAWLNE